MNVKVFDANCNVQIIPGLPSAQSAPLRNVFQSWHLVVFFPIAARAEDSK